MLWCVRIIWQTCVICDAYYWFLWLPCSGKCLQYLWELCGFSLIHVSMRFLRLLITCLVTHITFKQRFIHMCKHVSIKIALQRKCFVTNITLVWSFARMHKHVCLKTVTSSKSLATHITLVWLLAGVRQQVSLKIATLSKSLLTHVTFVWFIGCV